MFLLIKSLPISRLRYSKVPTVTVVTGVAPAESEVKDIEIDGVTLPVTVASVAGLLLKQLNQFESV